MSAGIAKSFIPTQLGFNEIGRRVDRQKANLSFGDFALAAAVAAFALGFVAPKASTIIQMVLAVIFVFLADIRLLPALVALQFTVTDFKGGVAASMETQYERFEGTVIFIGGLPFTSNYVLLLAILVRVLYDFAARGSIFNGTLGPGTLLGWLGMLGLTVHNSFLGRALGNSSWTIPTRTALSLCSLWYGISLGHNRMLVLQVLRRRMAPIVGLILALIFFTSMVTRIGWLASALGVTLAFDAWFGDNGSQRRRIFAAVLAFLAVAVGIGLRATPALTAAAKQYGGGFSATLTTMLVPLIAVGLTLLCVALRRKHKDRGWSPVAVTTVTAVLYVAFCVFPFVITALTRDFDPQARGYGEGVSLRERVAFKLLAERSAIWRGGIDQISNEPYVFVPAGRDGYLITNSGKSGRFTAGSHNLVIETLRSQGLIVGVVTLWFHYTAILAAAKACFVRPDSIGRVLGPAVIAVVIGTGVSGAAMLDASLAFPTLLVAGVCMAGNVSNTVSQPSYSPAARDGGGI